MCTYNVWDIIYIIFRREHRETALHHSSLSLKKLCHDFRHEISIDLIYMSIVFSTTIFCHQVGKYLVICSIFNLFAFRFVLCALPNGQREPRNVVAYQAIIEPYLLTRPKMGLNNQKFENLFYEYPAFDT